MKEIGSGGQRVKWDIKTSSEAVGRPQMNTKQMSPATPTRVLQFLRALLHVVLGASVGENHQHLRHVPPHAIVRGEDLLVDVLQSNAWGGGAGREPCLTGNTFRF